MCGRFALGIPKKRLEELFEATLPEEFVPRYNIAPGQEALAITSSGASMLQWGLIPHWANDPKVGFKMINARSETVFDKPAFCDPIRTSRCLIPAQAFYEWKRTGKNRHPYAITIYDTDVFSMAGITARWQNHATGKVIDSFAVLTTEPNRAMTEIHDRMPVILPPQTWETWLDPALNDRRTLDKLFTPSPDKSMRTWAVSKAVNRTTNEGPELLKTVRHTTPKQGSLLQF